MNLLDQLVALVASINELQQKLSDAQSAADELAKAKFDEGFAAGVASVGQGEQPASDKIYSQADVDAKLQEAIIPLESKIAELQARIDAIPSIIEEAKLALKVELAQKYAELQVIETAAETGFADLLK